MNDAVKRALPRIVKFRLGEDALVHKVVLAPDGEELVDMRELISGAEAYEELAMLAYGTRYVTTDPGTQLINGYLDDEGYATQYWDCDEQSWSEYYYENCR